MEDGHPNLEKSTYDVPIETKIAKLKCGLPGHGHDHGPVSRSPGFFPVAPYLRHFARQDEFPGLLRSVRLVSGELLLIAISFHRWGR